MNDFNNERYKPLFTNIINEKEKGLTKNQIRVLEWLESSVKLDYIINGKKKISSISYTRDSGYYKDLHLRIYKSNNEEIKIVINSQGHIREENNKNRDISNIVIIIDKILDK